jgi:HSP20 family protein
MIGWRFNEPSLLREMLEQMLEDQRRYRQPARGEPMPINVFDNGTSVVVEASLPGVKPEDVDVSSSQGLLTIQARSRVEEREYIHQEMRETRFLRQIVLPADCRYDEAGAELENGLLRITLPKTQPKTPEKIRIQVARREGGPEGGGTTIEAEPGSGYSEVKPPSQSSSRRKKQA